jgi:D-alanyl-D-alanine carboxypeptidase
MNHTSGIPRHIMSEKFLTFYTEENKKNPEFNMTTEEIIEYTLDIDPLFKVGEKMSYADTNYILLQYIIESVTNRDYYELIEERVTEPLGITQVIASKSRHVPRLSTGNLVNDNLFRINSKTNKDKNGNLLYNPGIEGAGGGFASTPIGLARLAKGLYEKKLISEEMYAQKMDTVTMAEGEGFRIGYGLGVMTHEVPLLGYAIGHSGFFPGYRADMYYFPKEKVAIAVMINSTVRVPLTQMAFGIADKIMKSEGIRKQ